MVSASLKPHVFYSRQLILEFSFRSQYKTRSCKIGYIFELSPNGRARIILLDWSAH